LTLLCLDGKRLWVVVAVERHVLAGPHGAVRGSWLIHSSSVVIKASQSILEDERGQRQTTVCIMIVNMQCVQVVAGKRIAKTNQQARRWRRRGRRWETARRRALRGRRFSFGSIKSNESR
jgi:hypothetical protein